MEDIKILEDFKTLTNSTTMPVDMKDRFLAVADADINRLRENGMV